MPRPVLLAAGAVALEGLAVLAVGVAALVASGAPAVWGFVILLGAGVTVAGLALVRGARGARGPAVVSQLLLLGVAFYAGVPSGRPEWGVPLALLGVVVLAGLLGRPGRAWADDVDQGVSG